MRGSRKFCQRGSNFDNVFFFLSLVDERKRDPNTTISGAAKHHLNGVSLACHVGIEYWFGSFVIFQGIRTTIAKKPYTRGDPKVLIVTL